MAKTQAPNKAVAAAVEEETQALATVQAAGNSALATATNARKGDTRGTEGIENEDVRLPFIAIAQKTSKAIDPTEEGKFIAGLQFGQMYNSETRDVYGKGPIQFIPLTLRKRAHLLKENGTLGDAVDWNDARVTWEGAKEQGLDKPEGQQIYDWAALLVINGEVQPLPVVLSFRSTSFGAGKSLNGFVRMRKPSFAGLYSLSVFIDKNESGNFGRFLVAPAGKPTDAQFEYAESVYDSIASSNIVINDVEVNEANGQEAPAVTGTVVEKTDVPF